MALGMVERAWGGVRASRHRVSPTASPARRVLASGGVVRRPDDNIAVVHRRRYDDWSLPKGKVEPGETPEAAALREVKEETGIECRLGPEIGTTTYHDAERREKVVRYWLMEPLDDVAFVPNDEVDELRWCSAAEAEHMLTYTHDRALVAQVASHSGRSRHRKEQTS
jgi:8-oxo-dGTP diphosphatase